MTNSKIVYLPLVFFLFACGIEDYPYIPHVPDYYIIETEFDNFIRFRLSENSENQFFTHYEIFYKIYISDVPEFTMGSENFSVINSTLLSDYNYLYNYLGSTIAAGTGGGGGTAANTLFSNRGFRTLEVEGANIDTDVLHRNNITNSIEITLEFLTLEIPILRKIDSGASWPLLRASEANPQPPVSIDDPRSSPYFINYPELYDSEFISNTEVNKDIFDHSRRQEFTGDVYTYACMYIVACGLNLQTYSPIYSAPTFLHVLRLPSPWQ